MLTQSLIVPFVFVLLSWAASTSLSEGLADRPGSLGRTYIVHVSKSQRPAVFTTAQDWYSSTLASVRGVQLQDLDELQHGPIYSYGTVFHGFAAKLTPAQAQALQKKQGVLSVVEDGVIHLHTTRTPEFLGLNTMSGLWPDSSYGDQVIIGVVDSGIWPERESFDDNMVGPVPARWKGICESGQGFNASLCNKKLIGARAFYKGYEAAVGPMNESEYKSARDSEGHGTHTASTAAGNSVYNASLGGLASGTARGMATLARIAVYKVCWQSGCVSSDILAAFEQAITDGVDIISLSAGGSVVPYFADPIAIGSFGAMERGILVSASAGNSGPSAQSVGNVAPWLLTVGASTLDRNFPATVMLSGNVSYTGTSLYTGDELRGAQLPLIYAGNAGLSGGNASVSLCLSGMLDPALVRGKIVVCDRGISARTAKGVVVKNAGGAGMILANTILNGEELIADSYDLPALLVGYKDGVAIKDYIGSSQAPTATLVFTGTVLGVKPAPVMAAFSSRGPNALTPEILKPDVTAPGVNILAAWTGKVGPTEQPGDNRVVAFNIMSGTSMSCPHVSGLAALLKGAHPEWSPAAIKSALMTTSFSMDNMGNTMQDNGDSTMSTPFAFGAGHVDPTSALDPGLVYDLNAQDYVDFLCSISLPSDMLALFTNGGYNCSGGKLDPSNLNYPSLSLVYYQDGNTSSYASTVSRTVTNVGLGSSVYTVAVSPPPGVSVKVEPSIISFTSMYEKKTYTVTCETSAKLLSSEDSDSRFGSLTWSDGTHHVRSPIAFTWQNGFFF
eukprot:c24226_g1_i1 orf=851-3208(+)